MKYKLVEPKTGQGRPKTAQYRNDYEKERETEEGAGRIHHCH